MRNCILLLFSLCISAIAVWCGMNDNITLKEHSTLAEKVDINLQLLSDDELDSNSNISQRDQAFLESQQLQRSLFQEEGEWNEEEYSELSTHKLATLQQYVQLSLATNTTTLLQHFATRSTFANVAKNRLLHSNIHIEKNSKITRFNENQHKTNIVEQPQSTQGKYVVIQITQSHLSKTTYLQSIKEEELHSKSASQVINSKTTQGLFNSVAVMLQQMQKHTHHMVKDEDVHVLDDQHYLVYITPSASASALASAVSTQESQTTTNRIIATPKFTTMNEQESGDNDNSVLQPDKSLQVDNVEELKIVEEEHVHHHVHPIHVLDVFSSSSTSLLKLSVRLRSYLHTRLTFSDFVLYSNKSKNKKSNKYINNTLPRDNIEHNVLEAERLQEQTQFINFTVVPELKLSHRYVKEYSENNAEMLELMVMTAHGMASEVVQTLRRSLQKITHDKEHRDVTLPSRLEEYKNCNVIFYTQQEMRKATHAESPLRDDYFIFRIMLDTNNNSNISKSSNNSDVEKYKCLGIVTAIAVHPAIRWIEHSARSPFVLNEIAASGIQGGYVTRNSTNSLTSSSSNNTNCQFRQCKNNKCSSKNLANSCNDANSCDNSEVVINNNYHATNLHPLWSMGINGSNEIILISDSGVDYRSCYFADDKEEISLYPTISHTHRKIISYHGCARDGEDKPNIGDQVNGHGTHVAGSALGATFYQSQVNTHANSFDVNYSANDRSLYSSFCAQNYIADSDDKEHSINTQNSFSSSDMSRYNGVAIAAKMFMQHMTCGGEKAGYVTIPKVLEDLYYPGYYAGARIGCNSWGFYPDMAYSAIEKIIDRIVYDHDDLLLLFASGNNAKWGTHIPGTAKNVLTVGSHVNSASATEQNVIASTSSWGKVYDERIKPELVGPGGLSVNSARSSGRKELYYQNKNVNSEEMVHVVQNESVCGTNTYHEPILLDEQVDKTMNKSEKYLLCNDNNSSDLVFSILEEHWQQQQQQQQYEQDKKSEYKHEYKQTLENKPRLTSDNECSVVRKTGTSMANGVTTGAAALIRQYLRDWHHIASPSASLLKATLIHSTVYLAKEVKRAGFGRVDLSLLPATPIEWVKEVHVQSINNDHTQKNTFMQGNKVVTEKQIVHLQNWLADREVVTHHSYKEYYFTATSLFDDNTKFTWNENLEELKQEQLKQQHEKPSQTYKETSEVNIKDSPVIDIRQEARLLKITLVWTDIAAAVEGTTKSLINDLDLMVVDVWGHMYYSNTHMSEASKKDGKFDRTNNVEQIRLELSANLAQEFRVIVYGNKVITNQGQQYSLVVSAPGLHYMKTVSPHVQHSSQLSEKEMERYKINNNNHSDNITNFINDKKKNKKDDTIQSVSQYCANNCSHHGTCDAASLTCACSTQYRFVDCSLCNEEVVCSGHGSCNDKTLTCTCDPNSHFVDQLSYLTSNYSTAEDVIAKHLTEDEMKSMESTAACSVCQTGWYGPWCNSRCECQNNGICNTTTGECMCVQNRRKNLSFFTSSSSSSSSFASSTRSLSKLEKLVSNTEKPWEQQQLAENKIGIMITEKMENNDDTSTQTLPPAHDSCFDGDSCQYCCPGYGGEECDEVSYWCDTSGNVVNITQDYQGWIEINSYRTYPRSMRCNWRLTAPRFHRIVLEFVELKLEYGFDTISVYDVKGNRTNTKHVANHLLVYNEPTELVRRYTGELWHIPPYTSKSNTLALQFISDWGPVNEGFKIRYSFVEIAQCNITCSLPKSQQAMWPSHEEQMLHVSAEHNALTHNEHLLVEQWNYTLKEQTWSGVEDVSEVMTCGSVLELPNWCICVPPYFGVNCKLRSDQSAIHNAITEAIKKDSSNNNLIVNTEINMTSSVNTTNVNTLQNKTSMHYTNMVSDEDSEIDLSTLQTPTISWAVAESTLHVLDIDTTHKPALYTRLWLTINGLSVLHVMHNTACTTPERMDEPHILELTFDMQVDKLMHKEYNFNGTNFTKAKIGKNTNTLVEVNTERHAMILKKFMNSNAIVHDVMESLVLSVSRIVAAEDEMWQSTFAHTQLLPLSTSFAQEEQELSSSSSSSSSHVKSCSLNSSTGQLVINVQMPVHRVMECHNSSTNRNDGDDADKQQDARHDSTFALMLLWNASRKVSFSSELLSIIETEGIDMLVGARMKDNDKVNVFLSSTVKSQIDKQQLEQELRESQNEEQEKEYDEYDFNLTCAEDISTNESISNVAQLCVGQSEQVPEWWLHDRNNEHHNNMSNRHSTNVTTQIVIICIILSGVLGLLLGQLMAISLQQGWWTRIRSVCCGQAESNVYDTVEVTWHSEDVIIANNTDSNNNYVSSLHADARSMREEDSYLQRVFSNDGSNELNNSGGALAINTSTTKHSNTKLGRANDEADEGIEMELVASAEANNGEMQEATNKNSATGAVETE